MKANATLIPFGILELASALLTIIFGTSRETSDFVVDCLQQWWDHSKYHPVERCWGILEMHWNGTLLDTVEKALGWAKTMTWKGRQPVVQLMQRVYHTGVRLTKAALKPLAERVRRSQTLSRWSASIHPHPTRAVPLCSPP